MVSKIKKNAIGRATKRWPSICPDEEEEKGEGNSLKLLIAIEKKLFSVVVD